MDMFYSCTFNNIIKVDFPRLKMIRGMNACYDMFGETNVDISLPELEIIDGDYACSYMFEYSRKLTSISFPKLNTIHGDCACEEMFSSCELIEDIYFNSLTASSFGNYTNQFTDMLYLTSTRKIHTVHFPSNLESTIQGLTGYPLFGGKAGYVVLAFDLPATN